MKCKVCGRKFRLRKRKMYLAVEPRSLYERLTKPEKTYECFDCPHCGCQHFLNIRLPEYKVTDDPDTEDEDEELEEERDDE